MILDGHIHINSRKGDREDFLRRLKKGGVDGGIVFSMPPSSFVHIGDSGSPKERLENLLYWTETCDSLYPFFWVDPIEEDAADQVLYAAERGVCGFKVICNRFFPGDKRALEVFKIIAELRKPILFHSGILYDGTPSSQYNRPAGFEPLLDVNGIRFAMAHISWPWCDEMIAVYGKYQNCRARRPNLSVELFIDTTPGTPPIYREDALTKLFRVGYEIENNIFFGTDNSANDYDSARARELIKRDNDIYSKLGLTEEVVNKIYEGNIRRFLGIS